MNKIKRYLVIGSAVFLMLHVVVVLPMYVMIEWRDSIYNPKNRDYVVEVAFNLGLDTDEVRQIDFDRRYK